jgi:hypothetical protein
MIIMGGGARETGKDIDPFLRPAPTKSFCAARIARAGLLVGAIIFREYPYSFESSERGNNQIYRLQCQIYPDWVVHFPIIGEAQICVVSSVLQ